MIFLESVSNILRMTCSGACETAINFYGPDIYLKENSKVLGEFYKNHPIMARVIAAPLAVISGVVKAILFPIISVIGLIVLPIISLVQCARGKQNSGNLCAGTVFCFMGVAASFAFFAIAGFYLPIVASACIFGSAIAFSICIHVYKAMKSPTIAN